MLISNQFRSIAQSNNQNNTQEGTCTKHKHLPQRKKEFPRMLGEDPQLEAKKIELLKKQSQREGNDETQLQIERNISTFEVCTFIVFVFFLILCVISQLRVNECYKANLALNNWINNSTFFDPARGKVTLDQIKYRNDFFEWIEAFLVEDIYQEEYYPGQPIPDYRKKALPENNILISPVRLTQRMKQLIENRDQATQKKLKFKWKDSGAPLQAYDPFQPQHEYNGKFAFLEYQIDGSFLNNGGYVINFDVHKNNKTETMEKIKNLKNGGYLNDQTRLIVIDMTFYNPYSMIYTSIALSLSFKANGLIHVENLNYLNVSDRYYNFSKQSDVLRMLSEIIYMVILIIYITIEVKAILKHITHNFETFKKQQEFIEIKQKIKLQREKEKQRLKRIREGAEEDVDEFGHTDFQDVYLPTENDKGTFDVINQKSQKVIMTYGVGILSFVPKGLKDHFQDIWNFFDVIIFTLATISVPMWLSIVRGHSRLFNNKPSIAFDEVLNLQGNESRFVWGSFAPKLDLDGFSDDIINASQSIELYQISLSLHKYAKLQGILICFVIIKGLNYVEKFSRKIGMLFQVIGTVQQEIINFCIFFFIFVLAFMKGFQIALGTDFNDFRTSSVTLIQLWRYMLNDNQIMTEAVSESKFWSSSLMLVMFVFLMQFINFNMIRALISHSYFTVARNNIVKMSIDELLQVKHWLVQLQEYKDPLINRLSDWVSKNKDKKDSKLATAAKLLHKHAISKLQKVQVKKDIQNKERQRWQAIQDIINERSELEMKTLNDSFVSQEDILNLQQENKRKFEEVLKHQEEKQENTEIKDKQEEMKLKEQEDNLLKIIKAQEDERNKFILSRMDWDKQFTDDAAENNEDALGRKAAHLLSEQEENLSENISIIRCGKILWRSIIFGLYMLLVIVVVQTQIKAHNSYLINQEINDYIHLISNKIGKGTVTIDSIKNKNDTLNFLKFSLPSLGETKTITAAINDNLPNTKSNYTAYFIDDRKYLVGDLIRFKFKFATKNPLMTQLMHDKVLTDKTLQYNQERTDIFQDAQAKNSDVLEKKWYTDLIVVPSYIKDQEQTTFNITMCEDYYGPNSQFVYKCDNTSQTYQVYTNMTLSFTEAVQIQKTFEDPDTQPFRFFEYSQILDRLQRDLFFDSKLLNLEVEFVSYEPFYDLHAITNINFNFDKYGTVTTAVDTHSIRLDNIQTTEDFITLIAAAVYIVLFGNIFMTFLTNFKDKFFAYKKWEKFEIEYLSDVEKRQRNQKTPEFIRILYVMFDSFTIINFFYTLLTLISIFKYFVFNLKVRSIVLQYPIWPNLSADFYDLANIERQFVVQNFMNQLQRAIHEFQSYKYYVTLSIICAAFKLFEYFDKSKNMRSLINVLNSVQVDLINFLVIFFCLIFGFKLFAYVIFGKNVLEFSSFWQSFMTIFQLSLNNQYQFKFIAQTVEISMFMTIVLFLIGSMLFIFVFSNIFLAIAMNSYEIEVGQFKQTSKHVQSNSEELSLLKSLLYCTVPKEGISQNNTSSSNQPETKQRDEQMVLGIDQNSHNQAKKPFIWAKDFDPYDPNSKYNEIHYLTGLEFLSIDMQMSNQSIRQWSTATAKMLLGELYQRTIVRNKAKQLMNQNFMYLQQTGGQTNENNFDYFSYQQRRLEYWDYLRSSIQCTAFQNAVLPIIILLKEKQVAELTQMYQIKKRNADLLYLKVSEMEQPIEQQLALNMHLSQKKQALEAQGVLLDEKIESGQFIGYDQKNNIVSVLKKQIKQPTYKVFNQVQMNQSMGDDTKILTAHVGEKLKMEVFEKRERVLSMKEEFLKSQKQKLNKLI